ncbi:MAG: DUF3426 domain-containing protein [Paraburkholderia sp.]|uniref:DUF3426 domain-containing protein n=1 Tax=Paraburkholderia sp. TaxID=1926495 RepID=UPI00121B2C47|nr:DUF3426 domain-containing protein [Paraburkholderia sp.]TAM05885.1 MAG: DUF3426 domain-containing protein [Paraburkholderia sp.]TAM31603.1 MAG: DUF3426 domain-containing protein [Paraburkholderia sp.]
MLLATRCPFCETVFRIQPAQLAVRRGLVRCGHCQETFDASGSLFDVPVGGDFASAVPVAADVVAGLTAAQPAPAAVHPPEGSPAASQPTGTPGAPDFATPGWDPWAQRADSHIDDRFLYNAEHLPSSGLTPSVTPTIVHAPAEPHFPPEPPADTGAAQAAAAAGAAAAAHSAAAHWQQVTPDLTEPTLSANEASSAHTGAPDPVPPGAAASAAAASASAKPGFSALSPDEGAAPFAVTREAPARESRRTGWRIVGALLALVLLALLAAQAAWWMRETVMVYWPASQRFYVQACEQLGCRVLPPRDIDGLQVEPSDLRQVDDPHHLELKVPLRNHFDVALAFPAIELTLLDRQNNVVVRRVLWPQDYVAPGTRIEAGLPARTTQTIIVRLDTGNVVASNFRIEIFYP